MIKPMPGTMRYPAGNRQAGFTLIETMIVVVIVAILVGVALPSYQSSLIKGRRADAKAALLDASNRQEQYMLDHSTYADDLDNLQYGDPAVSSEGYYVLSVLPCAAPGTIANCYVLTATPETGGVQEDDTLCANFILASDGDQTVSGTLDDNECW